ncbi:hypothetical protein DL89DRAFT_125208 [Linderina pennispora]|uniref:Uncharacterized protein n=1 Tax=Linderina pennispora TaxID=61395 RepID=A0A1Y1WD17_9FUNG|nr:uncharacterized protein DL89DRAFT_125208 [Linderina pennispora]ORX71421.1 hypothetical protein DL89DRAFT_125208 [Linderina pennispora]
MSISHCIWARARGVRGLYMLVRPSESGCGTAGSVFWTQAPFHRRARPHYESLEQSRSEQQPPALVRSLPSLPASVVPPAMWTAPMVCWTGVLGLGAPLAAQYLWSANRACLYLTSPMPCAGLF